VNVTLCPAHIVVCDADAVTEGVTAGLTVIVIAVEVAVAVVTQVALEVKITLTWSPFAKAVDEKVELVAPGTFVPLTCH
jgi:hypothetical protein